MPGPKKLLVAGALIALGGLAVAAPAAPAAVSIHKETKQSVDGEQTGTSVECPGGAPATAGGLRTPARYADQIFLNSSGPGTYDNQVFNDKWTTYSDNFDGGADSVKTTSYAVCNSSKTAADYALVGASSAIADDDFGSSAAYCSLADAVVGGGLYTNASLTDDAAIFSTAPADSNGDGVLDNGWAIDFANVPDLDHSPVTFYLYTVCEKGAAGKYTYPQKRVTVPDGKVKQAAAKCPKGRKAVGGGVSADGQLGLYVVVTSSYPAGRKWVGAVSNLASGDGYGREMVITAICRK